jgi:hypothetical protein
MSSSVDGRNAQAMAAPSLNSSLYFRTVRGPDRGMLTPQTG